MARRPLHALLVAAVSAALTVGLVLVPSTAGAAVRPGGPLSLATGAYFGALVNPNRSTPSSTTAEVEALQAKIGPAARHRQPLLHVQPGRRVDRRGAGHRRRPHPDDHLGCHVHPLDQQRLAGRLHPPAGHPYPQPRRHGLPPLLPRTRGRLPGHDGAERVRLHHRLEAGPEHLPERRRHQRGLGVVHDRVLVPGHPHPGPADLLPRRRLRRLDRCRRLQLRPRQARRPVEQLHDGLLPLVHVGRAAPQAADGRRVRGDGGSEPAHPQGRLVQRHARCGARRRSRCCRP